MSSTPFLRSLTGLAVAILLGSLAGCDQIGNPTAPAVPGGRIAGRVTAGGPIPTGRIEVSVADPPQGTEWRIRSDLDQEGRFSCDVPPGKYWVRLSLPWGGGSYYLSPDGHLSSSYAADTLVVDSFHDTSHLDVHMSSLVVNLEFPLEDMADDRARVQLYPDRSSGEDNPLFFSYSSGRVDMAEHSGTVSLVGIPPARYRIMMEIRRDQYSSETLWMPGVTDSADAPFYEIPVDSQLTCSFTQQTPSAHLAGTIGGGWLDLGGSFLPRMTLVGLDSTSILDVPLGDDGSFECDLIWPQPVKIRVEQGDITQFVGGPSFADATVYDLDPGQSATGIDLETASILLEPTESLQGALSFLPGEIEIYDPETMSLIAHADPVETFGNNFLLPNLWPGEFLLHLTTGSNDHGHASWVDQWYEESLDAEHARRVVIGEPGELLHLPWKILLGGTMSGVVTTSYPDEYLVITVEKAADGETWASNWLNSGSTSRPFTFLGIPDGDYRVRAGWTRWDPEGPINIESWYPGTAGRDSAAIITIENANTVENLDFPLE